LATSHGPESDAVNDGSHLTAVACACLLSLVVVRGDTGKLLSATAALLMCPRALASQNIHVRFGSGNLDLCLNTYSCCMFECTGIRVHHWDGPSKHRENVGCVCVAAADCRRKAFYGGRRCSKSSRILMFVMNWNRQ
jgi:hypothetical protein